MMVFVCLVMHMCVCRVCLYQYTEFYTFVLLNLCGPLNLHQNYCSYRYRRDSKFWPNVYLQKIVFAYFSFFIFILPSLSLAFT